MSAYLYLHFTQGADMAGLDTFTDACDLAAVKRAERLLHGAEETGWIEVWRNGRLLFSAVRSFV